MTTPDPYDAQPQQFRLRPLLVEAMRYDGTPQSATPIINWMCRNDATANWSEAYEAYTFPDGQGYPAFPGGIRMRRRDGETMIASAGDWVVRGVTGEFFPLSPDRFAETYEAATADPGAMREAASPTAANETEASR